MVDYLYNSENRKTGYCYPLFCACLFAFSALATSPMNSMAISFHAKTPLHPGGNNFLNEHARINLHKTNGKIYHPYDDNIIFSSNIYAIKRYDLLSEITAVIEYDKRSSIIGFAVIDTLKLPLIQQKKWSFHINGKISVAQQYAIFPYQKNRWNFEHQIGCGTYYQFSDIFQISLSVYHYRIINNLQYDNPAQSYIISDGGFATLRFQF